MKAPLLCRIALDTSKDAAAVVVVRNPLLSRAACAAVRLNEEELYIQLAQRVGTSVADSAKADALVLRKVAPCLLRTIFDAVS